MQIIYKPGNSLSQAICMTDKYILACVYVCVYKPLYFLIIIIIL